MSKDCLNDEDIITMDSLSEDIVKFEVTEENGKKKYNCFNRDSFIKYIKSERSKRIKLKNIKNPFTNQPFGEKFIKDNISENELPSSPLNRESQEEDELIDERFVRIRNYYEDYINESRGSNNEGTLNIIKRSVKREINYLFNNFRQHRQQMSWELFILTDDTFPRLNLTDINNHDMTSIYIENGKSYFYSIINEISERHNTQLGGKNNTKRRNKKNRRKTMKRGGGGDDDLDSIAGTLSIKRIKPGKGIFSLNRKDLRKFMKEVSKSRKSLPKQEINIILEESHNTTRKNKTANKKGRNVNISEQNNKIQMIETRKEMQEK